MIAIPTNDATGELNGFVLPIWHVDDGQPIEQVYLTTIAPGKMKGPHMHFRREGRFTCVFGDVRIVTREANGDYLARDMGDSFGYQMLVVEAGTPAALYNIGEGEARVLNMPYPAWRDNSDEHKVEDWEYEL